MPGQKRKYNVRFPPMSDTEPLNCPQPPVHLTGTHQENNAERYRGWTNRYSCTSHPMKQCIHSEKLFDFLKDLADQASTASTSECKTKGKWQSHRKRWQSVSIKTRSPEREEPPQKATNDLVINSDSSSVSYCDFT
ncbi:Dr1-associated corepressor [Labeo rohita]|uniref:Dr1-associated corepressor n=1 Tax=Labeo rohita TaxID=84645 RepID=A0ABQ8LV97_LABRO|nr:Dr1-associated corepressor [Labeo rohita]